MGWKRKREDPKKALREELVTLLPRLRRFSKGLAGDTDRGDDLLHTALERGLSRLDQLRDNTRLVSWMYRIIYTTWVDDVRRNVTRSNYLRVIHSEKSSGNNKTMQHESLTSIIDIRKALSALPEAFRAAILLVSVEGYSYSEASKILAVPVGTVASRVARARDMLNGQLMRGKGDVRRLKGESVS